MVPTHWVLIMCRKIDAESAMIQVNTRELREHIEQTFKPVLGKGFPMIPELQLKIQFRAIQAKELAGTYLIF